MSGDLDGGDDGDLLRPDAPELRALLSRVSRERQVQKDEIASLVELKQELGEHHAAFISNERKYLIKRWMRLSQASRASAEAEVERGTMDAEDVAQQTVVNNQRFAELRDQMLLRLGEIQSETSELGRTSKAVREELDEELRAELEVQYVAADSVRGSDDEEENRTVVRSAVFNQNRKASALLRRGLSRIAQLKSSKTVDVMRDLDEHLQEQSSNLTNSMLADHRHRMELTMRVRESATLVEAVSAKSGSRAVRELLQEFSIPPELKLKLIEKLGHTTKEALIEHAKAVDEAKAEAERAYIQLVRTERGNAELQDRIADLEERLEEAEQWRRDREAETETRLREEQDVTNSLRTVAASREAAASDIAARAKRLQKLLVQREAQIEKLEGKLSQADMAQLQLQRVIERKQASLESERAETLRIRRSIGQMAEHPRQTRIALQKLAKAERMRAIVETEVERLGLENEKLRQRVSDLEKRDTLRDVFASMDVDHDGCVSVTEAHNSLKKIIPDITTSALAAAASEAMQHVGQTATDSPGGMQFNAFARMIALLEKSAGVDFSDQQGLSTALHAVGEGHDPDDPQWRRLRLRTVFMNICGPWEPSEQDTHADDELWDESEDDIGGVASIPHRISTMSAAVAAAQRTSRSFDARDLAAAFVRANVPCSQEAVLAVIQYADTDEDARLTLLDFMRLCSDLSLEYLRFVEPTTEQEMLEQHAQAIRRFHMEGSSAAQQFEYPFVPREFFVDLLRIARKAAKQQARAPKKKARRRETPKPSKRRTRSGGRKRADKEDETEEETPLSSELKRASKREEMPTLSKRRQASVEEEAPSQPPVFNKRASVGTILHQHHANPDFKFAVSETRAIEAVREHEEELAEQRHRLVRNLSRLVGLQEDLGMNQVHESTTSDSSSSEEEHGDTLQVGARTKHEGARTKHEGKGKVKTTSLALPKASGSGAGVRKRKQEPESRAPGQPFGWIDVAEVVANSQQWMGAPQKPTLKPPLQARRLQLSVTSSGGSVSAPTSPKASSWASPRSVTPAQLQEHQLPVSAPTSPRLMYSSFAQQPPVFAYAREKKKKETEKKKPRRRGRKKERAARTSRSPSPLPFAERLAREELEHVEVHRAERVAKPKTPSPKKDQTVLPLSRTRRMQMRTAQIRIGDQFCPPPPSAAPIVPLPRPSTARPAKKAVPQRRTPKSARRRQAKKKRPTTHRPRQPLRRRPLQHPPVSAPRTDAVAMQFNFVSGVLKADDDLDTAASTL